MLAVIAEAQATVCKKLPPELQEVSYIIFLMCDSIFCVVISKLKTCAFQNLLKNDLLKVIWFDLW